MANPSFVGPEASTTFGGHLYDKAYRIRNTKLDTKVNIYLGPFQGLGRGPCFLSLIMPHTI
jgi:hypothetical protein